LGQIEVYEFLLFQRLNGEHRFWTTREVELALRERGFSNGVISGVRGDLLRLEWAGYFEAMVQRTHWMRAWRIKMKYVVKAVSVGKDIKGGKL